MACDWKDASNAAGTSLRSQDCTMEMARHFPNATFHAYEAPSVLAEFQVKYSKKARSCSPACHFKRRSMRRKIRWEVLNHLKSCFQICWFTGNYIPLLMWQSDKMIFYKTSFLKTTFLLARLWWSMSKLYFAASGRWFGMMLNLKDRKSNTVHVPIQRPFIWFFEIAQTSDVRIEALYLY